MHAQWNHTEIKAIRKQLVRLQRQLVTMQYVFTPEELTGLYSLINHLETTEWNREAAADFGHPATALRMDREEFNRGAQDLQSERLRNLLREYNKEPK
jgi:hypothetical protein